ncbi:succinyl-CoA synthetase beta subunit [Rhodoligotrophos appendicifer]|uniref:ATP-grasp domain-containing protein n=1 Tax=Rhodoligotrophos appendicifer TaxID=987056 RepID=UPI00117EDA31|nr:ATP-grasp domain-containing protein [Rhodoligotrophos appendicifer]
MKLIEADGKALLSRHGLPVPRGILVAPDSHASLDWTAPAAVKAQLTSGGRGLDGLVKLADAQDVLGEVEGIQEAMRRRGSEPFILVEEKISFSQEFYLSIRLDDLNQCPEILFSPHGGVHVEGHADALRTFPIDPLEPLGPHRLIAFFRQAAINPRLIGPLCRFAVQLYEVFRSEDAELIEINPLAVTERGLMALDAKIVLDDAAAFRHRDHASLASFGLRERALHGLEKRGAERGITFVELPGDIAVLTGGAGLGMVVLDALVDAGYQPANFVDTVSGSGSDLFQRMGELVFEHARSPHIRAILAYFTLSATSLKAVVDGLQELFRTNPPPKPIVLGMHASGAAEADITLVEAQKLFRSQGYDCVVELADLIDCLKAKVDPSPTGAP